MELDDFKAAWHTLDRKLERQNQLNLHLMTDRALDKARRGLRPLIGWTSVQMIFGAIVVGACWLFWQHPHPLHLQIAGAIVHVYGYALIGFGALVLSRIGRIDYALPVVEIQKRLLALRRSYVLSGVLVGLSWWLLWIPFMLVLTSIGGADLYAQAPSVIALMIGVGCAGLLGTWLLHRWAHRPGRERLAKWLDDGWTSHSIRNAQRKIDELARFESEDKNGI